MMPSGRVTPAPSISISGRLDDLVRCVVRCMHSHRDAFEVGDAGTVVCARASQSHKFGAAPAGAQRNPQCPKNSFSSSRPSDLSTLVYKLECGVPESRRRTTNST